MNGGRSARGTARWLPWVAMLCFATATAQAGKKPLLFPLQDGNLWILEAANRERRVIECVRATPKVLQVTGLTRFDLSLYGRPLATKLLRWDDVRGKLRATVHLKPRKRDRAAFAIGEARCDQLLLEWNPADRIIRTPTGTYSNCASLWFSVSDPAATACREVLSERVWFAPGVGPVMIQGRLDRTFLLVSARVGDKRIEPISGP